MRVIGEKREECPSVEASHFAGPDGFWWGLLERKERSVHQLRHHIVDYLTASGEVYFG